MVQGLIDLFSSGFNVELPSIDCWYIHRIDISYVYDLLNQDGIIICEYEEEIPYSSYDLIKEKKYGKTNIKIYRKK